MARLRFPGRPGYRFDRIGVRYSADEARQTTDPTLAIVANIHQGLKRFRDLFGDSDEDDIEFFGFTPSEVRAAERNLQHVIRQEQQLREQQEQKQKYRFERSKVTLASLAAAGLGISKNTRGAPINLRKTYKKIVDSGLVRDAADKIKSKAQHPVSEVAIATGKQNGQPVPDKVSNLKHIKLKRLSHNVDTQPVFRRPVGRPRKNNNPLPDVSSQKGSNFESIPAASSVFGSKPVSKYTSMARQILARATKQAAQTSSKLLTSTHKVRKFVLPTKSSRSSRVIKPNKRFLEDDSVHQLVAKQPKISPTSPTSVSTFKTPIFGMGVGGDKSNSFSAFQSCGLSLSPFNMNREKGFPVSSTPPQPSGTSSFMDGLTSQKPLGSLDQPLIVEGKRPRKPSLIMRMKLVEDDPADEIRLQQQLSDTLNPVKPSSSAPDGQKPHTDSKISTPQLPSQTKCFGTTKSLIAPAKLFTDSSTSSLSSKSFNSRYKHQQSVPGLSSQSTVVLRQAKLQLNRTALNRSKAALARSLKAQLKREAKLERKKHTSQNRLARLSVSAPLAVSPGLSLSQLSPFSKLASDSAIERQKSGLFEGIEAGAGSFSPGSFGSPPVTPSSLPTIKLENEKSENYQASLIKEETLLINYAPGSKWRCLVCSCMCIIKKNRKLPQVPLCKSCKKSYFFQLLPKPVSLSKRKCKCEGRCNIHFSQKSGLHCVPCKFRKFEAVIKKCEKLGIDPYKEEPFTPAKKQRHKSEEITTPESRRNKQKRGESDDFIPTRQRQKHRSGDKITELAGLRPSAKSPSHSKDLINASNLDKPLSVDVGQDTDPFSLSPPQTLSSAKSSPDKNSRSPSKKVSLTSNGSDRVSEDDEDSGTGRSRGRSRGPRIKHVCRRAAMVFPKQHATFPELPQKRTLTLSALPNEEKQQLWAKSKQEKAEGWCNKYSSTEDSGDEQLQTKLPATASPDRKLVSPKDEKSMDLRKERKMDSILDRKLSLSKEEKTDDVRVARLSRNKTATNAKSVPTITSKRMKKSPHEKANRLALAVRQRGYTRKIRCRECKGCKTPECGICVFCRDKPKFGGPGKIKKCCIHSVCLAPKIPRKALQAFIEPKSPTKTYRRDDDDQNGDHHTRSQSSGTGFHESSSRYQEKRANNHWRMDSSGNGAKDNGEDEVPLEGASEDMFHHNGLVSGPSTSFIQNGLDMDGSRLCSKTLNKVRCTKGRYSPAVEATIQLALTDVRNPFIGRMPETFIGRMKYREKISVLQKQSLAELKPVQNETAYSFDVPLKTHLIRADYEDNYDVETAWFHGFSLTLTGPSCVRALCYLCGSAGKHEMLYCIVCCQPYHSFCLDEDERPEDGGNEEEGDDYVDDSNHHHSNNNSNTISWCCRRCQFCHVCGHQNGLLKCHRCKDTYHPECLGPNYPTRPSHKNIWVCTKCVRCKSCGATTPGVGTNATWTYDFSLCYECGKLMDKGNFCPICHKCYSDDDWESKMVQCAVCESWVHAKCEELTDEMYQLVSYLPEDVQYTCRVCSTDSSPYWKRMLKSEFVNGLMNVLNNLMGSKCAQMLLESGPPRDIKKSKQNKRKMTDGSEINGDDNSNNETTSNRTLNSSTETADSSQDFSNSSFASLVDTGHVQELSALTAVRQSEKNMSSVAESHYTKHLLAIHDKEIVEKCDCETVQTSCSNKGTTSLRNSGIENLQYNDRLPEMCGDNVDNCSSTKGAGEEKCLRQTSNGMAGEIMGLKNAAKKALNTCVSGAIVNGEVRMHDATSNKGDGINNFLGLASKEGNTALIENPKATSAVNGNEKHYGDTIQAIANSKCDANNLVNSVCSDSHLTTFTPSCMPISSASSTNILPSASPSHTPDSLDIQVVSSQTDSCTSRISPPCQLNEASTAFPPASFYSKASGENVVKSLFSNQYLSHFSAADLMTESGSKCAFSEDQVRQSANSNIESISVDSNSKCLEYIQSRLNNESYEINSSVQPYEAFVDNLQHQQLDSSSVSTTTASQLDGLAHQSKEQQQKTAEKKGTAFPNPASLHVSFGHTIQESLNHNEEFPRDFNSIKLKIDSGSYSTVEEFSEDMVRIIQALLFENEQYTTRKKQANSMRSIFVKQMERSFPWFNVNTCKLWEHNRRLPAGMLKDAVLPPSSDHMYAQWLEKKNSPMSPQPSPFKRVSSPQKRINGDGDSSEMCAAERTQHHLVQNEDTRACLLCQQLGDDEPDCAGRLLYCGQDDWIHINCALWSAEVFEQVDGSLQNVLEAVSRGKKLRCNLCQQTGATVGCCEANCRANYHFMCARADKCVFQEDKTIFCKQHVDCVNMNVVKDGHFDLSGRVCVNLDKIRAKTSWGKAVDPATLNIIIGSCTVESLGVLQSSLSDTEECLYPVDFRCTRIYWSTQDARRRCVYTCRIVKVEPDIESPAVRIQDLRVVHDETHQDFVPLDRLNLENLGIPNFMKPVSKNCGLAGEACDEMDDVVFVGSDSVTVTMTSMSFSSQSINVTSITQMSNTATVLSESAGKVNLQPSSFQSVQNQILQSENPEHCFIVDEDDPHGVAKTWPIKSLGEKPKVLEPKLIDLSGLSPSTLELLSIKDQTKYIVPSPRSDMSRNIRAITSGSKDFPVREEELGLLKIADRLNSAASGKASCQNSDSDRSILKSPTLPMYSPLQQFSHFRNQTQHSQSQSSSPVSFRPKIRARSNSEESYGTPSPLLSPRRITTIFPSSSSPQLSQPHFNRARSESPITYIKSQGLTSHSFRSVSLSPPAIVVKNDYSFQSRAASFTSPSYSSAQSVSLNLMGSSGDSRMEFDGVCKDRTGKPGPVAPIVEVSESEDEEEMIIEDANKKSNLDTSIHFEHFETNSEESIHQPRSSSPDKDIGGTLVEEKLKTFRLSSENKDNSMELTSDVLSTENLQSILESVPPEVLEGDNVKVVVLTDVEDLTEEDIMKLASSVVQESTGDQVTGFENVETNTFCDGEVEDNDGQQGEEPTHDGRGDGTNSDQNDQGNASSNANIDGDHDVPESSGRGVTNDADGLEGSDCAQSTSDSNIFSTEHRSCCLSSSNTGLVPTSAGSSRERTQDSGDDDDLRKPHKDENNKNNKDVLYHDLDENEMENDIETLDTSSEGQPELVKNSEMSVEGHDLDRNPPLKSHTDGYSANFAQAVSVLNYNELEEKPCSGLIEELEVDSAGVTSGEQLESFEEANFTKDSKYMLLSSAKGKMPTSASENSQDDIIIRTPLEFHEEGNNSEKKVDVCSTDQMLDDSQCELDDNADHSYTETSEDDVKIIDLSDSEKAQKVDQVEVISLMSDKNTDQQSDASVGLSLLRAQVPGVKKNSNSTVKSGQNTASIIVSTQDTTTDEESDYLMLDDFSYSETNDEDNCNDRRSSAEKAGEPFQLSEPKVNVKKTQASPKEQQKELNTRCVRNDAADNQETSQQCSYQDINSSERKEVLVKNQESPQISQTPFLPPRQTQDCEEKISETIENISETTRFSKSADKMSCKNNAQTGQQYTGTKALRGNTQKFNSTSQIELKPCFVSLCRDDAIKCPTGQSSVRCETSSSKHILPEPKHIPLRVRMLSANQLKSDKSNRALPDLPSGTGCQVYSEHELKVGCSKKKPDLFHCVKGHECFKACDGDRKTDKQIDLLKSQEGELCDVPKKSVTEKCMQQSEISESKDKLTGEQNKLILDDSSHEQGHVISTEKTGGESFAKVNDNLVSGDAHDLQENYLDSKILEESKSSDMCQKVLESLGTFIDHLEPLEVELERTKKETHIGGHITHEILVESADEVDKHSSSSFPLEHSRSDVVCEERMTCHTLNLQKEDLTASVSKNEHKNIFDIEGPKEKTEIDKKSGVCLQQDEEVENFASNSAFHIPNIQDGCVEDNHNILYGLEEDGEDLVGREQLIMKREKKRRQNSSAGILKDNRDKDVDAKVEIIGPSLHDSEECTIASPSIHDTEKAEWKPQSSGSLSESKSCNNMTNPSSEEDEKELIQLDHKVSVPPDFTRPGEDKHFVHPVVSSEQKDRVDSGSEDNLHERIVEKIKAESLARSSPGEEGPFKCPTCKRMYRTRERYEFHVRDCDFEVSTSDEEDKPVVKELRSGKKFEIANEDRRQRVSLDVEKLKSLSSSSPSPLNEPLSIIITDEYKDEKFSPSSRDLSDDCSSVQSQDSRRSSLRQSTVTQRNAAPAHLAKVRHRDSKLSMSPDGSTCSSLLSPRSSTSRIEEKPSPKETMLEAVGLVSRRSLELSPNSELDGIGSAGALNKTIKLQPRVSPTAMAITPKREKRSPAHAGAGGVMRPSILAGGLPKPGSSHLKSIAITYDPVIVEEVKLEPLKPKRPRQKRIWWIEASECPEGAGEEKEEIRDEREDEESDDEEGVAARTRQRMSSELKSPTLRKGVAVRTGCRSDESNNRRSDEFNNQRLDESNAQKLDEANTQISDESNIQRSEANTCEDESKSNERESSKLRSKSKLHELVSQKKDTDTDTVSHLPNLVSSHRLSLTRDESKEKTHLECLKHGVNRETELGEENVHMDKEKSLPDELESGENSRSQKVNKDPDSYCEINSAEHFILSKKSLRSAKKKEKREKDSEDEDNGEDLSENLHQSEDPLISPLRRSRRPPSKTAKLSEYLTELKKEKEAFLKEETKSQKDTQMLSSLNERESMPHDIQTRRGRGRPRIYPEKERPISTERRGRGRPRSLPKPEDIGEEKIDKGEKNVSDTADSNCEKFADKTQDTSLLEAEPDTKFDQSLRSSHRLRGRSSSDAASEDFENVEDEKHASIDGQMGRVEAETTDNETGVRTRCSSLRQNQSGESEKSKKDSTIEVLQKGNCEYIDLVEGHSHSQELPPSVTENKTGVSDNEHNRGSTVANLPQQIMDTSTVETSKENSKMSSVSSYNPEEIKKDDDPNSVPPSSKQAPDISKPQGQKLRIVIRSPNVAAAHTIGELIKKTALSVNAKAFDITVTTKNSYTSLEREQTAERVCSSEKIINTVEEKQAETFESSHKDGVNDPFSIDAQESTEDTKSKDETPLVSRSVSPDSISAAYDIQSDDFSSETSNDGDDFPPSIPSNVDSVLPQVSCTTIADVTPYTQTACSNSGSIGVNKKPDDCNGNVNEEDDDVVIVKAVGLQPPERSLALKTSQTPFSLISHSQLTLPVPSTHSHQYSSALAIQTNTSSSVTVTSCGRIPSTSPVVQQSGAMSHIPQPLAASPTRQNIHPFMNLHHQPSPQQNQPPVMISEVSPGRFILQQQPNPRQEFLTSHDIGQSGLLLQNPSQGGIIIQAPSQSGIALQNATQSGIIFRHTNSAGLMLPPNNPPTILQGQQPILQSTVQGGLSFISLNPSNPLASTIISPLQPLQSHVNASSILPSSMGLNSLMQAATLGNQPLMISQPFIAQPGMFLPQLSTQPIVSQHSEQLDMALRQQQHQSHNSHQQQLTSSVKPTSIIIDPHAHMLSSGLSQSVLKASMHQYSPLKHRPVSAGNVLGQEVATPQLISSSVSTFQPRSSSSSALFSTPAVSSVLESQTPKTYTSSSTLAPVINLQKAQMTAPKLTKMDGAPTQINYMGSFDLNSSAIQSVMGSSQSFNQDASKRIMELVQSALKHQGKEQIPGVEVTTAVTNTPQGPKKVLRVFINEDILPSNKLQALSIPATTKETPSLGTPFVSTTSSAVASLLSLGQASSAASSQADFDSEWTKLQPSSSQTPKSQQQQQLQNLWSPSNTGYISIPINQSLSVTSRSSSQPLGNSRFLPSAQFRRALKPAVYSHSLKRKHAPSSASASNEDPQAKRPVFEKMLKSDGVFSGTLQPIVERHAYVSDPNNHHVEAPNQGNDHISSRLSQPLNSSYNINTMSSNQTTPSDSFTHNSSQEAVSGSLTGSDYIRLPTTVTDDCIAYQESQQHFTHHLQQHPYHHIAQQQLQQSPHKRASFPLMSPTKKPQAAITLSQGVKGHARKQILQKSLLKRDTLLQRGDKETRPQLPEKRKGGVRTRRPKTVVASHHPLIHHKKGVDSLPQPTLEEEVIATPLDLGKGDHPHGPGAKGDRERSQSRLRFEITSDDGFSCQGDTVEDAWNQVLEKVQDVRVASRVKQLSYAGISGRAMFGLDHDAVVYLIEQLYGAVHCHRNYKFRFHKYDLDQADEEVALNPTGAARSESFITRKPFDMFNFLKSVYRTKPGDDEREKEEEMALKSSRRATSLSLPMAMRFRKLKTFAKEAVDVYRSKIHGRGLFCKRNIDAGEMVIEYAGEVIRASLTDKREKYYESRGIGCYMFRIDDDEVVDATMHGSAARFINHSCEPNCFSKVILVDGKKHIVIFAMRPIKRGEELTYDYKFPIEEVKIPCSCGSKRCRKYLN